MKHLLYIFLFSLPSLLWAQGYTIESQPVCWSYLSVDSSLVQYSLASSTATDTKILFYLNASGATVDISAGGTITFGLCNCGSGGSGSVVAINGLSNVSSDTIQLGGTQTANITINGDGFALSITGQDSIELVATARLRLNSVFFPRNDGFDGQTLVYDASGDSLAWATISGENIYNADGAQTDQVRTDTLGGKTLVFDGRTGTGDTSTMVRLQADFSTDDSKTTFLSMETGAAGTPTDSLIFYDYDTSFKIESSSNLNIIADNFLQLDTDSMQFSINGNYGNGPGTYFIDQRVAPRGIEYQSQNYRNFFSDSSLIDKGYFLANQYWTRTGTRVYPTTLTDNVGIGIDPSTTARFVTRGSGTTSSTISFLIENSGGNDVLTVRDDGLVIVHGTTAALPSGAAGLQINTNNNFNADIWFGGQASSNGLFRHNSGVFTLGNVSTPSLFRFSTTGNGGGYPNLNVGGATNSTFNGFIRAQGASGNVQVPAAGFSAFSTGGTFQYTNATSTNTVAQYQANAAWTQLTGSGTGYNVGFIFNPSYSIASADTANFKLKLGAYLSEPTITLSPTTTTPFFHYKSVSDNLSLGTRPIYDFWSNTNSGNNSYAFRAEGTAPNWLRGNTSIGATSTTTTGTNLEVYGRAGTQQLTGRGSAPGISINTTTAGTGATASVVSGESSDLALRFTFTTGNDTLITGTWITVTFAGSAFNQKPIVQIDGDGSDDINAGLSAAQLKETCVVAATTTGFTIYVNTANIDIPSTLTTRFDFSVIIIGGNG